MGYSRVFTPDIDEVIMKEYRLNGEASFDILAERWDFPRFRIKNRYEGYLRPASKRPWTDEEDFRLLKVALEFKRQWNLVRLRFPDRNNIELRNRFEHLNNKLFQQKFQELVKNTKTKPEQFSGPFDEFIPSF